jgi:hypothetical protein
VGALAAALAALGSAAPQALAKPVPNPEFAAFSDCPATVKGVALCVVANTTGGSFTLGNKTVPITKTLTLQGGLTNKSQLLVPAADGNTLSQVPLTVPGGLLGIPGLEGIGGEVTATTELAGPVTVNEANLSTGKGPAVILPIKVKLDNTVLGSACYVGSEAEPINLQLITGTTGPPSPNKPITGSPGTLTVNPTATIFKFSGNSLVDNSFSAPGAAGCGGVLSFLIDPVVDLQVGIPAASGHNTAILNGSLAEASAKAVKQAHVLKK